MTNEDIYIARIERKLNKTIETYNKRFEEITKDINQFNKKIDSENKPRLFSFNLSSKKLLTIDVDTLKNKIQKIEDLLNHQAKELPNKKDLQDRFIDLNSKIDGLSIIQSDFIEKIDFIKEEIETFKEQQALTHKNNQHYFSSIDAFINESKSKFQTIENYLSSLNSKIEDCDTSLKQSQDKYAVKDELDNQMVNINNSLSDLAKQSKSEISKKINQFRQELNETKDLIVTKQDYKNDNDIISNKIYILEKDLNENLALIANKVDSSAELIESKNLENLNSLEDKINGKIDKGLLVSQDKIKHLKSEIEQKIENSEKKHLELVTKKITESNEINKDLVISEFDKISKQIEKVETENEAYVTEKHNENIKSISLINELIGTIKEELNLIQDKAVFKDDLSKTIEYLNKFLDEKEIKIIQNTEEKINKAETLIDSIELKINDLNIFLEKTAEKFENSKDKIVSKKVFDNELIIIKTQIDKLIENVDVLRLENNHTYTDLIDKFKDEAELLKVLVKEQLTDKISFELLDIKIDEFSKKMGSDFETKYKEEQKKIEKLTKDVATKAIQLEEKLNEQLKHSINRKEMNDELHLLDAQILDLKDIILKTSDDFNIINKGLEEKISRENDNVNTFLTEQSKNSVTLAHFEAFIKNQSQKLTELQNGLTTQLNLNTNEIRKVTTDIFQTKENIKVEFAIIKKDANEFDKAYQLNLKKIQENFNRIIQNLNKLNNKSE